MELIIKKENLARALIFTQNIAERKSTMPILGNIHISTKEDKLIFSASDLEVTATSFVNAKVIKDGSTTVSSKFFVDLVRELPEGEVLVKLEAGERLEFLSQTSDSSLRVLGQSALEYPSVPDVENTESGVEVKAKTLLEMLNKTLYAVTQDETRFNLNGVCFSTFENAEGNFLQLVATDGNRLSKIVRAIGKLKIEEQIIVPKKGLLELKKILENEKQEYVKLGIFENFLFVLSNSVKLSVRLVDAEFPNYQQVFPNERGLIINVNKINFENSLKRVSLMVTDKHKCVKFCLIKDILQISGNSPELGDAREQLEVEVIGERSADSEVPAGFNAKFMIDFTASLSEQENIITFEFYGADGPAKLFVENDESYASVIMPMRISNV